MHRNHGAAMTLMVMTLTVLLAACGGATTPTPSTSRSSATNSSGTQSSGTQSSGTQSSGTQSSSTASSTSPTSASASPGVRAPFAYVLLWPFASVAAAQKWQREALPGGHQPWRLDAGTTAVAFSRQYLGFGEINRVVRTRATAADAHVSVGYRIEGQTGTAAVVHLVRIGSGPTAGRPWEVVGTDDTPSFSLTRPPYGSSVSGTITAGGRIAGVDESIRVTARQLTGVVGSYCCRPAGAAAPWSVPLRLTSTHPGPITIVASTGGHLTAVERFAITGVHPGQ